MKPTDYRDQFTTVAGDPIANIVKYVNDKLDPDKIQEIYVGADSRQKPRSTHYVVSVIIRTFGKGCHVLIYQEYTPKKKVRFERLWHEVLLTYNVASLILDGVAKLDKKNFYVHLDLNPDPIHGSNQVYAPAMGFMKSLDMPHANICAKPDAPAASFASDNYMLPKRVVTPNG